MKKEIFLICNAHLDPVWQWEWPVGMAEALSTFRIAANFCEEFEGFVFNHNEALLYRWVEEHDPALFARIQELVKAGKWHIMGGWYLQPDCVMAGGESLIRQMTFGREYFKEKFGDVPTVAVNVDSFGHDRGLVQVLVKNGYTGYLIGRPPQLHDGRKLKEFIWDGYADHQLPVCNAGAFGAYSSYLGKSVDKFNTIIADQADKERLMILWGVGNHGGGPSRKDLENIRVWREENKDRFSAEHSTPEAYFAGLDTADLPHVDVDLGPVMVGCYTSQQQVKQLHAKLENALLQTEKMCTAAHYQVGAPIPESILKNAEETLLFNEFHDILPGSSIRDAETSALQSMGGAIEALKKARVNAFVRLAADLPAPPQGTTPILIYNPHPWPVDTVAECDFMLPDQNWNGDWTDYEVYDGEKLLPSQLVKENSTIPLDWSKQLAVQVTVEPFAMKRLIARPKSLDKQPVVAQPTGDLLTMTAGDAVVSIDRKTGYIAAYTVGGKSLLTSQAGELRVMKDNEDPWGMTVSSFMEELGVFTLATAERAGELAGLPHPLAPVRLIEDGPVRMAVEAVLVYEQSHAVVTYTLEKASGDLRVHIRLGMMQANRAVKWALPTGFAGKPIGQGVFGHKALFDDGTENVAQRWLAVQGEECTLTVINRGTYGSSFKENVLYQTLVRTAVHCAHPIYERQILPDDRCLPHIDMGVLDYDFVIKGGTTTERLDHVERESQIWNEAPMAMSIFTAGSGERELSHFITLDNPLVTMTSCRQTKDGVVVRLFNQTEQKQSVTVTSGGHGVQPGVTLAPMEYTEIILDQIGSYAQ